MLLRHAHDRIDIHGLSRSPPDSDHHPSVREVPDIERLQRTVESPAEIRERRRGHPLRPPHPAQDDGRWGQLRCHGHLGDAATEVLQNERRFVDRQGAEPDDIGAFVRRMERLYVILHEVSRRTHRKGVLEADLSFLESRRR